MSVSSINLGTTQSLPAGTTGNSVLAAFQSQYGAVQYNNQMMSRYPYYSYLQYPAAGSGSLGFFGQNMSQVTPQLCNVEQTGTLGNYSYLLQSIAFDIFLYIPTTANNQPTAYTTDALAPYADIVHGLTQGGYFDFTIGNTLWDQIPLPFMYSPPAQGRARVEVSQGAFAFTQAGLTPFAVTGAQDSLCYADLERRALRRRNFVNPIFIAPQQTFSASIIYDFGLIPIISTSVITSTAILYVGCIFDGWRFAPVS
jgi:hypothetical protein